MIFATNDKGKLKEIRDILKDKNIDIDVEFNGNFWQNTCRIINL